ncbi:MAG: (Fe-S)-binding protein, partial [Candidatus Adiutrix sp.]
SDCSTCAHGLAHYDDFVPNSPLADEIRPQLPKVMEVNTLVRDIIGIDKSALRPICSTVTYHDSCHAARGLGVRTAPRDILMSIPEIKFVEMEKADSCCGGAGSYGFSHPEMSGKIAASKVQHIKASGAETLAVSCPACTLQLAAGLRRQNLTINIKHPVELLAAASLKK